MADVKNVTFGKPKVGGAIFVSPITEDISIKNASDEIGESFKNLGYVSEDGLTNNNTAETEDIKAWGGDTVLNLQTAKPDTFTFTLIEVLNIEVLKTIYGEKNVEGTLEEGITVKANSTPGESKAFVAEMILNGGVIKRIYIPNGVVSEVGEITYTDGEAVGYETTLKALPDKEGNTHYEYISKSKEVKKKEKNFEM